MEKNITDLAILMQDDMIMKKMAEAILDDEGGYIDGKILLEKMDEKISWIKNEIKSDTKSEGILENCPLCKIKLPNKKSITRRIHDIIYHKSYYLQQCKDAT